MTTILGGEDPINRFDQMLIYGQHPIYKTRQFYDIIVDRPRT